MALLLILLTCFLQNCTANQGPPPTTPGNPPTNPPPDAPQPSNIAVKRYGFTDTPYTGLCKTGGPDVYTVMSLYLRWDKPGGGEPLQRIKFKVKQSGDDRLPKVDGGSSDYQYTLREASATKCVTTIAGDELPLFVTVFFKYSIISPGVGACKATHYLISNRLENVPCSDSSAQFFSDMFTITSDPGGIKTFQSFTSKATIQIKSDKRDYVMEKSIAYFQLEPFKLPENMTNLFVEFLTLRGTHLRNAVEVNRFSRKMFGSMKISYLQKASTAITADMILKKLSHKDLPGFHVPSALSSLSATPNVWRTRQNIRNIKSSRTAVFQMYLENPTAITSGNKIKIYIVIEGENDVLAPTDEYIQVLRNAENKFSISYHDKNGVELFKLDNDISPIASTAPQFLHLSVSIGIGIMFFEPNSGTGGHFNAQYKLCRTISTWYDGHVEKKYYLKTKVDHITKLIPNYDNDDSSKMVDFKIQMKPYGTAADINDLDPGLRMFGFYMTAGAFPGIVDVAVASPAPMPGLDRCFHPGVVPGECFSYAFLKNMAESPNQHYTNKALLSTCSPFTQVGGTNRCRYCADEKNCLIPMPGFNRELSYSDVIDLGIPIRSVLEIESGSDSQHYVDFVHGSTTYKLRCPMPCKILSFSFFHIFVIFSNVFNFLGGTCSLANDLDCITCPSGSTPVTKNQFSYSFKDCLCDSNQKCKPKNHKKRIS